MTLMGGGLFSAVNFIYIAQIHKTCHQDTLQRQFHQIIQLKLVQIDGFFLIIQSVVLRKHKDNKSCASYAVLNTSFPSEEGIYSLYLIMNLRPNCSKKDFCCFAD